MTRPCGFFLSTFLMLSPIIAHADQAAAACSASIFPEARTIDMKLGIEKTAMIQVCAGISNALTKAMDESH